MTKLYVTDVVIDGVSNNFYCYFVTARAPQFLFMQGPLLTLPMEILPFWQIG